MDPSAADAARRRWLRYERYPYLVAKLLYFALFAAVVFGLLHAIQGVLLPVLASLFIAYLLDPAVDHFEERGWSRTGTIGLFVIVGTLLTFGLLLFLYPTLVMILSRIGSGFPTLLQGIEQDALPWIEATFGIAVPTSFVEVTSQYGEALRAQIPTVLEAVSVAAGDLFAQTGSVVSGLLNAVMIPVFTFYFLRDFDEMRLAAVDYLPLHNRDWLLERIARSDAVVGAWFRGQVEVACILALLYVLGLSLTFGLSGTGVMAGLAIGVFAGLLNIIPYVGFAVGFGLAALLALLDWHGWGPIVGVAATFGIVQTLEGYVITPRIVGEKVGLSPVVVILALLAGAELLGVLGVLLALPIAGVLRALLPDAVEAYHNTVFYRGEDAGDPR
jgi:predicted PurR-regulated permease PerM